MSILIKGMTMPKTCFDCPFMYHRTLCAANTKLVFDDRDYSELKGRYDGCPLIELPDHGDLIDRDGLRQVMRLSDSCKRCERDAYKCQYYDEMTAMDVCGIIDDLPVVIPAERSEDGEA